MKLGSKETVFKLDTSADVTAIYHEFYKRLGYTTLQEPSKLHDPRYHKLKIMGSSKKYSLTREDVHYREYLLLREKEHAMETNLGGLAQETKRKIRTNCMLHGMFPPRSATIFMIFFTLRYVQVLPKSYYIQSAVSWLLLLCETIIITESINFIHF